MMASAATAPISTPTRSAFSQCDVAPRSLSACHFSDSGTPMRIRKMSRAGRAPEIISSRQAELASRCDTLASDSPTPRSAPRAPSITLPSPRLRRATSRKPTFAAAPISPAVTARDFPGQSSLTSATPSDHSPPIPSDAMKRSTATCQASVAKPHRPVNTA